MKKILSILCVLLAVAFAQATPPTNSPAAPFFNGVTVNSNGVLTSPTNFFSTNAALLNASIAGGGNLKGASNLLDVANSGQARTNLGAAPLVGFNLLTTNFDALSNNFTVLSNGFFQISNRFTTISNLVVGLTNWSNGISATVGSNTVNIAFLGTTSAALVINLDTVSNSTALKLERSGGMATNLTVTNLTANGPTIVSGLTANRALVSGDNKELKSTSVTETEIGYVAGAQANIQVQINNKATLNHVHAGTDITSGIIPAARKGTGTADSSTVLWGDDVYRSPGFNTNAMANYDTNQFGTNISGKVHVNNGAALTNIQGQGTFVLDGVTATNVGIGSIHISRDGDGAVVFSGPDEPSGTISFMRLAKITDEAVYELTPSLDGITDTRLGRSDQPFTKGYFTTLYLGGTNITALMGGGGGSISFNTNQFSSSGVVTNIKSGAVTTNNVIEGVPTLGVAESSGVFVKTNAAGSLVGGVVEDPGSVIKVEGEGSMSYGYATNGGKIIVEGADDARNGQYAFGVAVNGGLIHSTYYGGSVWGYATGTNSELMAGYIGTGVFGAAQGGGKILTTGSGAFATGVALDQGSQITSGGQGSYAFGIAQGGGVINASGYGALAHGNAPLTNASIVASGAGSFAGGHATDDLEEAGTTIAASGPGSMAFGAGNLSTSGRGSFAFGSEFSNTENSFAVGYGSKQFEVKTSGISLNSQTDAITLVMHDTLLLNDQSMFLDSSAYVDLHTDGASGATLNVASGSFGFAADGTFTATGDATIDGKTTSIGGIDPPYILYDAHTRAETKARVLIEVPKEKQTGSALFFNKDTHHHEYYVASEDKFFDLITDKELTAPTSQTVSASTKIIKADKEKRKADRLAKIPKVKKPTLPLPAQTKPKAATKLKTPKQ